MNFQTFERNNHSLLLWGKNKIKSQNFKLKET